MVFGLDTYEKFVKVPGVVEIRYRSDDPEFYAPAVDIFEEQRRGLPDSHGIKDKRSKIQSYFTCLLCDCHLYGVVQLRSHCRGIKHMKNTAQRELEYKREQKKKSQDLKDFVGKETYKNEEKLNMNREGLSNEYMEDGIPEIKNERGGWKKSQKVKEESLNDRRSQRLKTSPERRSPPRRVKLESRDDYNDQVRTHDHSRERWRSRSPRRRRSQSLRRRSSRKPESSRDNKPSRDRHRSQDGDLDKSRHQVKNEVDDDEEGIEEVTRSGNFKNWRTATINIKTRDDEPRSSQSHHYGANEEPTASSMEEDVQRLHNRVAKVVKDSINIFYPGAPEFQANLHKIKDDDAYSKIARELSHKLRAKIKESYKAYHDGDLKGVRVTPDIIAFIEQEVERYFEPIPVIKKRKY